MAEWITRAAFGERIGVSGAMVSRYVKAGLPTRPDKRIEWPAGEEWHRKFVAPTRSGNHRFRQNQKNTAKGKPELVQIVAEPEPAMVQSVADLLKRLHGPGMVRAAAIAKGIGLSPAQQRAAVYIACSWLWSVAGDDLCTVAAPEGLAVDYSGIAGLKLSAAEERESDRLSEIADSALGIPTGPERNAKSQSKGAAPNAGDVPNDRTGGTNAYGKDLRN